jgi:hypothetical protein
VSIEKSRFHRKDAKTGAGLIGFVKDFLCVPCVSAVE